METIKGPAAQGSDSEVLRAVRAKIEHGWCQRYYAKDSNGERVPPDSPTAVCWCILGAYKAVTHDTQRGPFRFIDNALRGTGYSFADDWQDAEGRTKGDVLAFMDKAIALAEGTAPKAPSAIASDSTAPDNEGDDP